MSKSAKGSVRMTGGCIVRWVRTLRLEAALLGTTNGIGRPVHLIVVPGHIRIVGT